MNQKTENWGGSRTGSGRKPLPDSAKKKTVVVRVNQELLPEIEKLKQGLSDYKESSLDTNQCVKARRKDSRVICY